MTSAFEPEIHQDILIGEDDFVLLISPYSHELSGTFDETDEINGSKAVAAFEQALANDPNFGVFKEFVGQIALDHNLQGGWIADDVHILIGREEDCVRAHEKLDARYTASCPLNYKEYVAYADEANLPYEDVPEAGSAAFH